MSIIGRKWGNAKKHNEQILEHDRLKPNTHTHGYTLSHSVLCSAIDNT